VIDQISMSAPAAGAPGLAVLMTRERWIEVARIVATGVVALLFWRGLVPIQVLWAAVAVGLYPLVKTGLLDLVHEHKVGTEIFVTIATLVAVFGGETVAFLAFHLIPSSFEIQEGPNKGKKGVYAVVEVMTQDAEIVTVQTGAQNILTQLVKAWEEGKFPFTATVEIKQTGTAGRSTQWLRSPDATV